MPVHTEPIHYPATTCTLTFRISSWIVHILKWMIENREVDHLKQCALMHKLTTKWYSPSPRSLTQQHFIFSSSHLKGKPLSGVMPFSIYGSFYKGQLPSLKIHLTSLVTYIMHRLASGWISLIQLIALWSMDTLHYLIKEATRWI